MNLLEFRVSFLDKGTWYTLTIQCQSLAECLKVINLLYGKVDKRLIRIKVPGQARSAA